MELIFAVTATSNTVMVIVGTTLSGVKNVLGEILHVIHTFNHPVNYATRSTVALVLNLMRMVLGSVEVVKHVFVVNAEWKSVTS